jgi:hypothetical protein
MKLLTLSGSIIPDKYRGGSADSCKSRAVERRGAFVNGTQGYTHRYHPHPRLSASQIGDYLSANSTNRRRILKDAKFPPANIVIRYEDARTALRSHLATNGDGKSALNSAIVGFKRKSEYGDITPWKKQTYKLCSDALEIFQGTEPKMGLGSTIFVTPTIHNSKLRISGVNVSVNLDLMTQKVDNKGVKTIGGVILLFSKTKASEKDAAMRCQAIAMLAYEILTSHAKANETCDPRMCMAIDVFNGKVYRAKAQQKQLRNAVETSCEEVTAMWPNVKPPPKYNGPPIPKI